MLAAARAASTCALALARRTSGSQPVRAMSAQARRRGETEEERRARKAAVKEAKAAKRAAREGVRQVADPDFGRKQCTLCGRPRDTLIRCQVDASQRWHMVRCEAG